MGENILDIHVGIDFGGLGASAVYRQDGMARINFNPNYDNT